MTAADKLHEVETERDAYRAMLCDVIASAHPNERDHPCMSKHWARARELLKNGPSAPVPSAPDPRNGKWTCSTNEERWDHSEEFDTREEALAYAMTDFAEEYGLDDGDSVLVGQMREITPDSIAGHGADAWRVIRNLDERIFELVGDEVDNELDVTKEQESDLDERMTVTIRDWMLAHGIAPTCWTLDHIEHHTFERCRETRAGEVIPMHPIVERCIRAIEHDGDCEWP